MSQVEALFQSPLVQVRNLCCTTGRSGESGLRGETLAHLCIVRRGCFHYHLGSRTYFADPGRALIHDNDAEYRTSHPCEGGDDCTAIVLTPELMEQAFGPRRRHELIDFEVTPAAQVSHARAYALLRQHEPERLAGEEAVIGLVNAIARRRPLRSRAPHLGAERMRIVQRTKALLNASLDQNLSLETIAVDAGCSPFHLMRVFRSHTGQTIRAYRARLRVAAALEQMLQGAWDLTDLALQCGFASHSHLSETFRSVLDESPSEIRMRLNGDLVQERRQRLEAALKGAA
jgi:AraC family transcriptional regulator